VGPRVGLNSVAKREVPGYHGESNPDRPDRPARSLVAMKLSRLSATVMQGSISF